jgi:UDP-N-acetylglucosamine 2-epimerase
LVGADYDKILAESEKILSETKSKTRLKAQNPYGTGKSSQKIEEKIRTYFEN